MILVVLSIHAELASSTARGRSYCETGLLMKKKQTNKQKQQQLDIAVSSRWHGPCRCLFLDLWPRNLRSDEEVTMETFACLPKDYMLTPLVWQFDVVWNLTFMMWHIWPFDSLNDLRSWWKKYTCTTAKCIVPNQVKSFYYL